MTSSLYVTIYTVKPVKPLLYPGLIVCVCVCVHLCVRVCADESLLKMADVNHIPQTIASHVTLPLRSSETPPHGVDMLRADPRDSFHQGEKFRHKLH